jgi:cytochrome P450
VVTLMRDQVAAIVDALIDDLPESGTVDLVSAFAYPLAAIVIDDSAGHGDETPLDQPARRPPESTARVAAWRPWQRPAGPIDRSRCLVV